MPDLFEAQVTGRDPRLNDIVATPTVEPSSPVEPYLSESAEIPVAPVLRTPKYTNMHIFTSYCELPKNVRFENQEDGEKILLFLRKSFMTNFSWLFFTSLLIFFPIAVALFGMSIVSQFPWRIVLIASLFYCLLATSYIFASFITWYFNITLVTDRRIVDIDFQDLVYKDVAETKLTLVQDVKYTETGALRTLFDFGDVLIQTAGTIDNFDLLAMPRPERIVNTIEDLIGRGGRNV